MEVWEAIILGVIQGLAEFLPISSSGHLVLIQKMMGLEGDMLFFDTMLHVGTLAAVFVVMWKEIFALLRKPIQALTGYLILATVPLVVGTLLFGDVFETAFEGHLLGWGFLLTAVLLFVMEKLPSGKLDLHNMGWGRALLAGVVQVIAVFPGVSRSGSTIFGGRVVGVEKGNAAQFAFLMSIPAILGSVVWQGKDVLETGVGDISALCVIAGMVAAAITGYFAMKLLLDLVKKGKLWYFGIYTAALGLFVILDQSLLHLIF